MIVNCEDAPERVVVGHPFNPVYLLPLVELVAGPKTSKEILEKAQNIYESTGKIVLKLDREVDGFISDRLQEAMWREALHMVANCCLLSTSPSPPDHSTCRMPSYA